MLLVTKKQMDKLQENWEKDNMELKPILKLFKPAGAATWIFSSIDPEDGDTLFGLCDLGMGFPELGYASLSELQDIRIKVKLGPMEGTLKIERDRHFRPDHLMSAYYEAAMANSGITERPEALDKGRQAAQTAKAQRKAAKA